MSVSGDLVSPALENPAILAQLDLSAWDVTVRQARRGGLLARLGELLNERGLLADVPSRPRVHMESARLTTARRATAVRWEVAKIHKALWKLGVPIVLLKGAAYVVAGLPPARGRMFSDIDIMVPKPALDDVEAALRHQGWAGTHLDAYDQRYYRKWMHELPPLRHVKRQTVLDVHHTILPETARLRPDPQKLFASARPVEGYDDLYVLAPVDMVLHSATHLFHDGELEHGLRDLVDLDDLLRHFSAQESFWDELVSRARELDLTRPLYYALRFTSRILRTPVPEATIKESESGRPRGFFGAALMDALFVRALAPDHASCRGAYSPLARWLLYVRSHYLRMPLHLLIPHLLRKALKPVYEKGDQ